MGVDRRNHLFAPGLSLGCVQTAIILNTLAMKCEVDQLHVPPHGFHSTLEPTQGQICQSPTDATSGKWHLNGS